MTREGIDVWSFRDLKDASDEELKKWVASLPIEDGEREQLRTDLGMEKEEKVDVSGDDNI